MTKAAALQRLLTWLSPAFPVGAFAWSGGLETAISEDGPTDSSALLNWLTGLLAHGGLRTDAILLAEAHRAGAIANAAALAEIADLCLALSPAWERCLETTTTGDAFIAASAAWPSAVLGLLPRPCPYPVAVGALAGAHQIDLRATLLAWLTAAVQNQVSVAVRLVPLGQAAGLTVIAALEPVVAQLADEAALAGLADIGGIAYVADIAQMRHETLQPRLFRS